MEALVVICMLLLTLVLCNVQVKSVKTGSVFWTIGCCLSYFYMVRPPATLPVTFVLMFCLQKRLSVIF